jgi:hypothetical protein
LTVILNYIILIFVYLIRIFKIVNLNRHLTVKTNLLVMKFVTKGPYIFLCPFLSNCNNFSSKTHTYAGNRRFQFDRPSSFAKRRLLVAITNHPTDKKSNGILNIFADPSKCRPSNAFYSTIIWFWQLSASDIKIRRLFRKLIQTFELKAFREVLTMPFTPTRVL